MTSEESKVQKICNCLYLLTNDIKLAEATDASRTHSNIRDAFTSDLKKNVHLTFQKMENYSDIKAYVTEYIESCLGDTCSACDYLKFLQLCLVLLRSLKLALTEETNSDSKNNDASKLPVPKALLSISQKNTLQKCLQFTVALGILPNLLRGIGIPLSKRLKHAVILEHFTSESTLYQKHIQIAVCLDTLLGCLECEAMQSTILSYHGTDILAALLQLCHAPIKKIDKIEESPTEPTTTDKSNHQELQIISMMLAHRKYFAPFLETFLKQICPSLLMWELLLFQGISLKANEPDAAACKAPLWLRKICNQMMTDMVLQNHGIADLVQVVLDKAYDADVEIGKVDTVRIEAVARLITYNPVRHISLGDYIERLSKQVFQLLHLKGSQMDGLLKYIASCIILQFCERDLKSAEEHFLVKLLKPLWGCVRQADSSQIIVVKEVDLTTCIEDLHQIFTVAANPLSRKYTRLLFPYSHCLCKMFFFMVRGKSFLKSKVRSLINTILTNSSEEDALSLLYAVSFPKHKHSGLYKTNVSFANGDEGGIVAVDKVEEDFPDEIIRYHAILGLLSELQNKNLNRSYILLVLKEFCAFHLESKNNANDPVNIKAGILFNALLQELSEWNIDIGEALMSNISEVIDILMTLLESICDSSPEESFFDKTLWVVLMILNSILESGHQLTSADWSSLKKCLPNLEKLHNSDIEPDLKEIIRTLKVHIATHGTVSKNDPEFMKDFPTDFPEHPYANLKPSENGMMDFVERFEQDCNLVVESIKSKPPVTDETCFKGTSAFVKHTLDEIQAQKLAANCSQKSSGSLKTIKESANGKKESTYEAAMTDIGSNCVPVMGHGLIELVKLLNEKDEETIKNKNEVLKTLRKNLEHEDSYVFLPAIQGLSILEALDPDLVLPVVLKEYQVSEDRQVIVKLGEVLLKICNLYGESIYKYKDIILHACLVGTKRDDPQIRSSSLSNLGQACMYLKFNISGHWLQEILNCVLSLLKTDPDLEVRRCAVMVINLMLKGVGKDMFQVLDSEIKTLYTQLKIVYNGETDFALRLHSQSALEEINAIMMDMFNPTLSLSKEIRILQ